MNTDISGTSFVHKVPIDETSFDHLAGSISAFAGIVCGKMFYDRLTISLHIDLYHKILNKCIDNISA